MHGLPAASPTRIRCSSVQCSPLQFGAGRIRCGAVLPKRRLLKSFNRRDIPPRFFSLESAIPGGITSSPLSGNRSSNLFCPTPLLARRTPSSTQYRGFKQPLRAPPASSPSGREPLPCSEIDFTFLPFSRGFKVYIYIYTQRVGGLVVEERTMKVVVVLVFVGSSATCTTHSRSHSLSYSRSRSRSRS